jgi:adenylate cyclase
MKLKIHGPNALKPEGERWRLLPEDASAPPVIENEKAPFVIGRSEDCDLVLPEGERYRAGTSRWHCCLLNEGSEWSVRDGSLAPLPDTGRPKPSISGTLVNGRRISSPTILKHGDSIEVGPWRFEILFSDAEPASSLDAGDILKDVAAGEGRKVDAADPKLKETFGQLHELVQRLAQIPSIEESLTALLSYTTNKIEAAEVASILITHPEGGFDVRLAWQKNLGRVPDFRFSASLLQSLPPDQSFLLESKMHNESESMRVQDISSGLLLPLWGKGERLGVFYMDNRRSGHTFTESDLYLGSAIASLVSLQLTLEEQAKITRIEENMARYFAPDVVDRIIEQSEGGAAIGLEVQEKDVTVLFVDMEAFTEMSRSKTPGEISEILNPYLETVASVIQAEGGHVNKFIGDAVMGIFGAQPGDDSQDPARCAAQAVRAALKIPGAWAAEAQKRHLPKTRVRIGINSGRAVVGNIGYSARLEYSVLGDAVNVASRFEKLAPPNAAAVSEATRALTAEVFEYESLGQKEIKGVGTLEAFKPLRAEESAPGEPG